MTSDHEFLHTCPLCGGRLYLREAHLGSEVPCPHCGERFTAQADVVVHDDETRWEMGLDEPPEPRVPGRVRHPAIARYRETGDVAPAIFPCSRCSKDMELLPEHAGHEVPCPHCGHRFVPEAGDVVPPPRARAVLQDGAGRLQDVTTGRNPKARTVLNLSIAAIAGAVFGCWCCPFTIPLAFCGPVALAMAWGPRRTLLRDGRKDRELEQAFWVAFVATGIAVLAVGYVAVSVLVAALGGL